MSSTDFFDDDLIKQRDTAKKIRLQTSEEPVGLINDLSGPDEIPVRPVSDFNLTRMARHKQDVSAQMATATQELERLKSRQESLEREKKELEAVRRKHGEYEAGKREMIEHLQESLVVMEKDELQAEMLAELLSATRKRFKEMQAEVESVREETWAEDQIRDELNKALVRLDDIRVEFNKTTAKLEAAGSVHQPATAERKAVIFEERRDRNEEDRSFYHWLKVGTAVTLPLIVTLIVLMLVFIGFYMTGLF